MNTLGVATDLGADYSRSVTVIRSAVDCADARAIQHLHRQSAGRRAVMRAYRGPDLTRCVHRSNLSHRVVCWQNVANPRRTWQWRTHGDVRTNGEHSHVPRL